MKDLWNGCYDPKMGMPEGQFKRTFCRVCLNLACERSAGSQTAWNRRVTTQVERLLVKPAFADPKDPKYAQVRAIDFPSTTRTAIRQEIGERRGDWSVPSDADIATFASQFVKSVDTPAPEPAPSPTETVLQSIPVVGVRGDAYEVSQVERDGVVTWRCTCKAFLFGGGNPCKHIQQTQERDAPLPTMSSSAAMVPPPAMTPPTYPAHPTTIPQVGNIPMPSGGIMVGGATPHVSKERNHVIDPWAPPPPKPKVIPIGGKVILGGKG